MYEMLQILKPDGDLTTESPGLDPDQLRDMYRWMVLSREFDRRMVALQRQGRIGTYATLEGQEAVQIGSAMALLPDDFIFPSYREHAVQLMRGMPPDVVMGATHAYTSTGVSWGRTTVFCSAPEAGLDW